MQTVIRKCYKLTSFDASIVSRKTVNINLLQGKNEKISKLLKSSKTKFQILLNFEMDSLKKSLFLLVLLKVLSICESTIFSKCFVTEPKCPNENVSFFLYTRDTQETPTVLNVSDPNSIFKVKFVKNRPLVVIVHGYTGHKNFSPNKQIRPAYFQKDDFNIISVDYSNLVEEPCYSYAVKNLPTVANCTGQMLNLLMGTNIFRLEDIHVIGFSLGEATSLKIWSG